MLLLILRRKMIRKKIANNLSVRILQDLWLTENEASLYILMLDYPRSSVKQLVVRTSFARTMLYYILNSLEEKGLVSMRKEHKKSFYIPENPEKFYDLLREKEEEFEKRKKNLREFIPKLKHSYILRWKIPIVKTFKWVEDYEKLLENTFLWGVKWIRMYENFYAGKPALETRDNYDRKRIARKIKKHTLFFESEESLKELVKKTYNDYTVFKSIKEWSVLPFETDMILYNGKIIYTTYSEYEPTAILIEDEALFQMQKNIFENLWKQGTDRTLYYTEINK